MELKPAGEHPPFTPRLSRSHWPSTPTSPQISLSISIGGGQSIPGRPMRRLQRQVSTAVHRTALHCTASACGMLPMASRHGWVHCRHVPLLLTWNRLMVLLLADSLRVLVRIELSRRFRHQSSFACWTPPPWSDCAGDSIHHLRRQTGGTRRGTRRGSRNYVHGRS